MACFLVLNALEMKYWEVAVVCFNVLRGQNEAGGLVLGAPPALNKRHWPGK